MNADEFVAELENLIRARYAAICVTTFEEERCLLILRNIAGRLNKRVIIWTATKGLVLDGKNLDAKSVDFRTATLMAFELGREPSLFVWCDAHTYLKNQPVNARAFKELCQALRDGCPSNSLLISPVMDIPIELQKEVTVLDMPLPDMGEARRIVDTFVSGYVGHAELSIDNSQEAIESLSAAAVGLAQEEIENSLAKSLVKRRALSRNEVDLVLEEKKQIIRKAGILEYIPTEKFDLSKIGGLHNLKNWLEKRKGAFSQAARNFGVEYPRGVLLVGIPGCGKSLSAKCVASAWKMPLLKLDMGRIFSGIVGSSEANMRIALNLCETVAPAILWIDEIEKGLSGSDSGSSDGGASTRVFGTLLTWMQEKTNPVFIFATANNILNLPPELLRKGRFDEIFFVDLPSEEERGEIFSIMIKNCKRELDNFDIERLVAASGESEFGEGIRLTGSEIEAVVRDALLEAYYRKSVNPDVCDIITQDIVNEISKIVPLSKSRSSDIKHLREWAAENAVRASLSTISDGQRMEETSKSHVSEVSVGRNIDF
ncbi:MAG: AAA family ATPase [Synergistaceae bacterium]|jgi:SpoVK/Ycf46/Vps4 family AAA+-type ATPase|nr:AAA family ATPase [Synergistaceae bacterium]